MVFVHDVKSAILVGSQRKELPLKRIQPRLLFPALVLFPEKFSSSQFPQPGSPSNLTTQQQARRGPTPAATCQLKPDRLPGVAHSFGSELWLFGDTYMFIGAR